MASPVPTEIKQAGATGLQIRWGDEHLSVYPVVFLRRSCSCAACVDEWSGVRTLRPDQVPEDVRPLRVQPVGRYAIGIEWSDGHKSGIYSFEYLRRICPCPQCQDSTKRTEEDEQ